MKMKDSSKVDSLAYYMPGEAHAFVARLKIFWSSIPTTKCPDRNHMYGDLKSYI